MRLFRTLPDLVSSILLRVALSAVNIVDISPVKICTLPPDPGYGDCNVEPVVKFYFDYYDLKCKKFMYLNCKGSNLNRFDTEEECVRVCHHTACQPGEVLALSSTSSPVICEKPDQCPKGFRCSYDKIFRKHFCCGFSNLDHACPNDSVAYSSSSTQTALQCSPSTIRNQCPEDFLCVKKGKAGACCRPHRGFCPYGQSAAIDSSSGHSMKCNSMLSQFSCPEFYECITPYQGNPWGFCCSSEIKGKCPDGTSPYLYSENGQAQVCTVGVTICRVGYTCQGQGNSVIGFCCTERSRNTLESNEATEKSSSNSNSSENLANDGLATADLDEHISEPSTALTSTLHSYAYDLMTVLSCPYQLKPTFLTDSQIIMECTKTDHITSSCPAPAKCVRAPRDVLKRSVCCSGSVLSYKSLKISYVP